MVNLNNICMFEGRTTQNQKYSQFNGSSGPVDKVFFSVNVPRVLTSQQRQEIKNGNPNNIKQSDFVNFSLIGAQVKVLQQFFPAGTPIKVFARYTEYEKTNSATGQKEYGHVFEVESISFVSTPSQNTGNNNAGNGNNGGYQQQNNNYQQQLQQNNYQQQPQQQQPQQQQPQQQQPQGNFQMFNDGDFPF